MVLHIVLFPQVGIETKRVYQHTAVYGTDAPKDPAVQRGGLWCIMNHPGLGNNRSVSIPIIAQ